MKNRLLSFLILVITILTLGLASCNDDVFIEPLKVSAESGELGPDQKELFIDISGGDWVVKNMWFYDDEGQTYANNNDGTFEIHTAFSELTALVKSKGLEINLISCLNNNPASLCFTVTNEYDTRDIVVTVFPTGSYDIEIQDVSYVLDQWGGFPNEDFTSQVITYAYPQGLAEATSFAFPQLDDMPVLYRFEPWNEDDIFARLVFGSGVVVPVPTYGPFIGDKLNFWIMADEKAELTMSRKHFFSPYIPPMPAAVDLPAGRPLDVSLYCYYESIGLQCSIKAVNPATGLSETVKGRLRMMMPMKFTSEVQFR